VVMERQEAAYAALQRLGQFDRVVLWFEHDSYDQLILAYLLSRLGAMDAKPPIDLICAAQVPGVSRFIGLGQLSAEVIRWLWQSRRDVGAPDFALGAEVWAALAAPSPEALWAIARRGTPQVPAMAGALKRHVMELPSTTNGLSLSAHLTLEVLAERGPMEARELFRVLTIEREPLPFLGDLMYWRELDALSAAARPAIEAPSNETHGAWPHRSVRITDLGEKLLAGSEDWLSCGPPARFVGGVEIAPGRRPLWRFDGAAQTLVFR
jgi:hypothetical protein